MKKLLNKFILVFISLLVVFGTILPNFSVAKAADPWIHTWYGETNPFNWYAKVYDTNNPGEIFGERYTAAQVQWVVYGLFSMFLNLVPGNPELTICATQGDIGSCGQAIVDIVSPTIGLSDSSTNNQTLASSISNTIGLSPISGVVYFKNLANKFSIVTPAKAQGVGFTTGASSVLTLWKITRNMSYSLIIVAVIILSFMIMFRVKISPQVVISVQSAIPKLIIALILITFSYAIAGILIDLMYVVIGLLSSFIASGNELSNLNASQLFNEFVTKYSAVQYIIGYWFAFLLASIGTISSSGWGIILIIFAIIAVFAVLWWSIKIMFELLKNFAMIMLTIVTGPLEIMMGTITGAMGFGKWLKKLVSYLAVYPVMIVMFFLSFFFLVQGSGDLSIFNNILPFQPKTVITHNSWDPPMALNTSTRGDTELIWVIISFVVFSQITKVSKMIQTLISGRPWEYGTAIGEATGYAKGAWGMTGAPIVKGVGERIFNRTVTDERIQSIIDALSKLLPKKKT